MSDLREYLALLGEAPRFAPPGARYLPAGGPAPAVWAPPTGSRDEAYRQVLSAARGRTTLHPVFVDLISRGFNLGSNPRRWALGVSDGYAMLIRPELRTGFPAISGPAMEGVAGALITRGFDPDYDRR